MSGDERIAKDEGEELSQTRAVHFLFRVENFHLLYLSLSFYAMILRFPCAKNLHPLYFNITKYRDPVLRRRFCQRMSRAVRGYSWIEQRTPIA